MQIGDRLSNVVMLWGPPDTYITPLMAVQAAQLTSLLPHGWFECYLDVDVDPVTLRRQDYFLIGCRGGPPFDSIRIDRLPRGFSVDLMMNDSGGYCRTLPEAFQLIRDAINVQLAE